MAFQGQYTWSNLMLKLKCVIFPCQKKEKSSTDGMSLGVDVSIINGKWESVQETCLNTVIFFAFLLNGDLVSGPNL